MAFKEFREKVKRFVEDHFDSNDLDDESEDIWDDQDYKNWESVCKLASRMTLKPGESYYIQEGGSSHSDCGILVNDNFVAHYDGNGYETYPPDADSYVEMLLRDEGDEYDEYDEYDGSEEDGEYLKIRLSKKNAGDDVWQLWILSML